MALQRLKITAHKLVFFIVIANPHKNYLTHSTETNGSMELADDLKALHILH